MSASKKDSQRSKEKRDEAYIARGRDVETAAEWSDVAPANGRPIDRGQDADAPASGQSAASSGTLGWFALAFSVVSWFVLPQWFGLAGIIMGGAAWFTGSRGLWSIVVGSIAIVAYLALVPYYS